MKTFSILTTALLSLFFLVATVQVNAQCPVPTGLGVTVVDPITVTMTWNAMPGATTYRIEVSNALNNPVPFLYVNNNVGANLLNLGGLTEGSAYKFKVRSVCSGGGKSSWSPVFTFLAGTGGFSCDIPTGLSVTNITSTTADLIWNLVPNINTYMVRVEAGSGNPVPFVFQGPVTGNTYTITGLNPSSNYRFKVRSLCGAGSDSNWAPRINFATTAAIGGSNPASLVSHNNWEQEAVINVFPNPSSGNVYIAFNGESLPEKADLMVYDLTGRLVLEMNSLDLTGDDVFEISVADLQEGLYAVIARFGDHTSVSKLQVVHN